MCGHTLYVIYWNEHVRWKVLVAYISDKIKENQLTLCGVDKKLHQNGR